MGVPEDLLHAACEFETSPLASLGPGKGSLSARCDENSIWITPSGKKFSSLSPADLLLLDLDGNVLQGSGKPSLDEIFHRAVYRARPDVGGIVHTHSPHATAWACIGEPVQPLILALVLMVGGAVEVAPFAFPGTAELGERVVEGLGSRNAVLLENHGVVAVGKNIDKALACASTVENVAQIQTISASVGKIHPLTQQVLEQGLAFETGYSQPRP